MSAPQPASQQDGTYPRPQLTRPNWTDLTGTWAFRHDDGNVGRAEGWHRGFDGGPSIVVPFPPESVASGIDAPGFHPVVWYSRTAPAVKGAAGERVLLHFGAVDYRASVWIDGQLVGSHEGGHTPFSFDVTAELGGDGDHVLVVRAEDDPHDTTQPRGKQDWHEEPHAIWYRRTTGIWQTVWLEVVPAVSIDYLRWDVRTHSDVALTVRFRGTPPVGTTLAVELSFGAERLASVTAAVRPGAHSIALEVRIPRQENGMAEDEIQWSPRRPNLVDATVSLTAGEAVDTVATYFGLRTVGVGGGHFLLNGHPYDVHSVLNQAYWPESNLAAPSPVAHRREVELIKELGFNACRIHQKIEDPRFHFWADRLGLLVWGETPATYSFSPLAIQRLTREWMDAVERDASHPCIVTWVPFNESWGVQHLAYEPAQRAFSRALTDLTRALDPYRPVVSNDGWEQQNTDIITIHDYEGEGTVMAATYADTAARQHLIADLPPAGRPQFVGQADDRGQPVMLTEFGGINFQPDARREDGWGYTSAASGDEWIDKVAALFAAVRASSFLVGSCYTQLTDTMQETNGLLRADRTPKVPMEVIRRAVTGE
jgi:beta-galactosidase/beta-glucuronidase